MATAEAENIDIGRHFEVMSPQAKNAWSVVENLAQKAEAARDVARENVQLAGGKISWKDIMNDAMRHLALLQLDRDATHRVTVARRGSSRMMGASCSAQAFASARRFGTSVLAP